MRRAAIVVLGLLVLGCSQSDPTRDWTPRREDTPRLQKYIAAADYKVDQLLRDYNDPKKNKSRPEDIRPMDYDRKVLERNWKGRPTLMVVYILRHPTFNTPENLRQFTVWVDEQTRVAELYDE